MTKGTSKSGPEGCGRGDAGGLLDRKLGTDLIWNYGSVAFLGLSGVVINLLVVISWGSEGLGVFNQIYAVYVVASQVAGGGIQFSSLRHAALYRDAPEALSKTVWSAAGLSLVLGLLCAAALYLLAGSIGSLMESPRVGKGIALACPGLALFSVNKTYLGVMNGLRSMKLFAVCQSLRYALIIAFVCGLIYWGADLPWLGLAFSFSEMVLFCLLSWLVARTTRPTIKSLNLATAKQHLAFGLKGFMSGVIIEINTRVDVLMLGVFLNDQLVGIYSFAAMIGEGFHQLLAVIRANINPILVRFWVERDLARLRSLTLNLQRWVYAGAAVLAVSILVLYDPLVERMVSDPSALQGWRPLAILLLGLVVYSGYVPFDFILLQAGQPGWHSILFAVNMTINVMLNLVLIPHWGIVGAATATAASYIMSVFTLNILVYRRLGIMLPKIWEKAVE